MYWGYNLLQNHLLESILRSRNRNETTCKTMLGHICYNYTYSDLRHTNTSNTNDISKVQMREKNKLKNLHEIQLIELAAKLLPKKNY